MPILTTSDKAIQRNIVAQAQSYGLRGWRVVILHGVAERNGLAICTCGKGADCPDPGKHPRLKGWPVEATADEERIGQLFERFPDSNLGVLLGPSSAIVDVEFDNDEGKATAERLLAECFTPTFNSSRSVHRLFQFPEGLAIPSAVVHAQGLELRFGTDAKGSQSVFPPSVHASGVAYRWVRGLSPDDVEPQPFPSALAELLAKPSFSNGNGQAGSSHDFVAEGHLWESPGVPKGQRNPTLAKLVGRYLATYGTTDFANLLAHALVWNSRCQPPEAEAAVEKVVRALWNKESQKQAQAEATVVQPASPILVPTIAKSKVVLRQYSAIEAKPIEWLWPGRIPVGMVTMLAGAGGWGKSTLASDIVSRLSRSVPFPDGATCPLGDSIILSAEESPEYILKPRLVAMGADCRRVHDLSHVEENGEDRPLALPEDGGIVREVLASHPETKLLVVDTIADAVGNIDEGRNIPTRRALRPLKRLAEEFRLAVICIAHVGKAKDVAADQKILGSIAFTNLARCCWHVGPDGDDEEDDRKLRRRLWLPGKSNIPLANGLAFHTQDAGGSAVIAWEEGELFGDADQLYQDSQPKTSRVAEAEAFLQTVLARGPVLAKTVEEQAEAMGHAIKTLRRAKVVVGVLSRKTADGWLWELPPGGNREGIFQF